jgi:threonine dehydratase
MIPDHWLEEAEHRIEKYIRKTPLTHDPELDLYLKWENHQETGSFKARGATNKILSLEPWERERGLVTASAGNHGQGVARAGKLVGAPVIVFASEHAAPVKLEAMRALGADVRLVPGGYGEAEQAGLDFARSSGGAWISPYNDGIVIAGQGTLAREVLAELPAQQRYTWVVPVGGGGLISGIGAVLQMANRPRTDQEKAHRLVGVQSEASPFGYAVFKSGSQEGVMELPSLADGLAGPIEADSVTLPMLKSSVDDFVLVSEAEIAEAIAYAWQRYQERIEGSAAAALAAVLFNRVKNRPAVVILSGGNIEKDVHSRIVNGEWNPANSA